MHYKLSPSSLSTLTGKPSSTIVDIVKSSVTLNKRAIQKSIEMRLNPQIIHKGILREPQTHSKR